MTFGVEPICAVLPIAPCRYYALKARAHDPTRQPARARRDASLAEHLARVWREHREVYGVWTVWQQLGREGVAVARCTVARLMRRLGLAGAVRGRAFRRTTLPDTTAPRPPDLVTRQFTATRPNQRWGRPWYNRGRRLEPLGYVPPGGFEQAYHDRQAAPAVMAVLT